MKDLHRGYVYQKVLSRRPVLQHKHDSVRTECRVCACVFAVSEMFHLALRKTCTHCKHIRVDRWTKRAYNSPCHFRSNSTWQWHTYSAVSGDNSWPADGRNAKDMALCVVRQPLHPDFDRCHPWQLIVVLLKRRCFLAIRVKGPRFTILPQNLLCFLTIICL